MKPISLNIITLQDGMQPESLRPGRDAADQIIADSSRVTYNVELFQFFKFSEGLSHQFCRILSQNSALGRPHCWSARSVVFFLRDIHEYFIVR